MKTYEPTPVIRTLIASIAMFLFVVPAAAHGATLTTESLNAQINGTFSKSSTGRTLLQLKNEIGLTFVIAPNGQPYAPNQEAFRPSSGVHYYGIAGSIIRKAEGAPTQETLLRYSSAEICVWQSMRTHLAMDMINMRLGLHTGGSQSERKRSPLETFQSGNTAVECPGGTTAMIGTIPVTTGHPTITAIIAQPAPRFPKVSLKQARKRIIRALNAQVAPLALKRLSCRLIRGGRDVRCALRFTSGTVSHDGLAGFGYEIGGRHWRLFLTTEALDTKCWEKYRARVCKNGGLEYRAHQPGSLDIW